MALKYEVKVDKVSITRSIKLGILKGTKDTVKQTKKELLESKNQPAKYEDRGEALSQMLGLTGLDKYTISGKLLESWRKQISNIRIAFSQDTLNINMFDSRPLDDGTKWMGLKYAPKFANAYPKGVGKDAQKWRALDRTRGYKTRSGSLIQKSRGYVIDGYRPLPNSAGRGFTWATNPYKGRGYWFLYHQGYIGGRGGGISYVPNQFLYSAYFFILGGSVSKLLTPGGAQLKLSNDYKVRWQNNIAKRANQELRK
jgi:hypothetical protein